MHTKFENWCRLCAKNGDCTKDLLGEDLSSINLRLIVEKHFSIQIDLHDDAPTTVCDDCSEFIRKLFEFEEMVLLSQSTFECSSFVEGIEEESIDVKLEIPSCFEGDPEERDNALKEEHIDVDFACARCDKIFPSQNALRGHMKSHSPAKLSCDICGNKFSKSSSLRTHRELVHSNVRPFICDECGRGFKRSGDLTRHKEFHRDDTPFACSICGKKFNSKLVAKRHELNHSVKGLKCTICGQELKTQHTLRGHMRTHSEEKEFECNFCNRKFRYKKNLNCHLKTHTGVQPYNCAFCNQAFSLRWNCRTHMRSIHPVEFSQYESEGKRTVITSLVKQKFACGWRRTDESNETQENNKPP